MNSIIMAILAATAVYRLELVDEIPYIVGQDGVKRQVVIVEPDEYAVLTGRVDLAMKTLNATSDGRKKLHGNVTSTTINGSDKIVVYADGYTHREKMETRRAETINTFAGRNEKKSIKRTYPNMSERQKAFMEKRDAALYATPKTVTIEHDAATGKDIVK